MTEGLQSSRFQVVIKIVRIQASEQSLHPGYSGIWQGFWRLSQMTQSLIILPEMESRPWEAANILRGSPVDLLAKAYSYIKQYY